MRRSYHEISGLSISTLTPLASTPTPLQLHPEPRYIFKLWQIFTERTNPLIKIVHVPSLQQKILDSSWNLTRCRPSFQALLFAIYLLAAVCLSPAECMDYFGESRNHLLERYRIGAWQSLLAAGVFETRELEVLQAFVLFLVMKRITFRNKTFAEFYLVVLRPGVRCFNVSDRCSESTDTQTGFGQREHSKWSIAL